MFAEHLHNDRQHSEPQTQRSSDEANEVKSLHSYASGRVQSSDRQEPNGNNRLFSDNVKCSEKNKQRMMC